MARHPFRLDVALPEGRLARAGVIAAMVVGGLVALLVPILFVLMLLGMLRGG